MINLQQKAFLDHATKNLPPKEQIDEKIGPMNPKKKGMWKGDSVAEIRAAKAKAKKSGNVTREREANFALVAKSHFKKGAVKEELHGDLFDENNPAIGTKPLAAAEQGHGKKQLGKEGGSTCGTPPAAEQGHGKKAVLGSLDKKEEVEMNDTVVEGGDARGQGGEPTGKKTLGPVRIKADTTGTPAAEQGHGKKPVTGEICRDGHPGHAGFLGHGGAAEQGHGKKPVLGVICREDVEALVNAIVDEKPGETTEAFAKAVAPVVSQYIAQFKEHLAQRILGVEEDIADDQELSGDEVEVQDDDSQKNEEVEETE